jgi:hypothetical protein
MISGLISLTSGKSGSSLNYFLEMDLGVCALASLLVARHMWRRKSTRVPFRIDFATLLPLLYIGLPVLVVSGFVCYSHIVRGLRSEAARNSAALVQILKCNPDPVMSEDMTLLYKADKQLPFEPAIVAELAAVHIWDETPLIGLISSHRFSVMIIGSGSDSVRRYSPAVINAIRQNYRPTETLAEFDDSYTVYLPSHNRDRTTLSGDKTGAADPCVKRE